MIVAYFAGLFLVSYITNRKADNQSFFIGNRKSPWYLVAIGMIGASLSGVTFVSVPGWVISSKMYYMQMVLGYFLGYVTIIHVLLPLYYRLNLTSIYTYLEGRFGKSTYKTGAVLFLVSRIIGASFRLYLVANVLQYIIFDDLKVPFFITVVITLLLIWLYTYKGGIKTIVWTDALQTILMLAAMGFCIFHVSKAMDLSLSGIFHAVSQHENSTMFNFFNWKASGFFLKQFFSGAFVTIVMTGLDQDMMQKNLSCRSLKDAQKNMYTYSLAFLPVNLLFLSLGVLLVVYTQFTGMAIPEKSDDLFPMVVKYGNLPSIVGVLFILGVIAAAYSSADSALTSLTTSFVVDIVGIRNKSEEQIKSLRQKVHVLMTVILFVIIIIFNWYNNDSVIANLFKAAGYTYGPLLGLYAYGLFTKRKIHSVYVIYVAVLCPVISYLINKYSHLIIDGYKMGFEVLILNGVLTFGFLYLTSFIMKRRDSLK
ncbi:MAG: sodium:solute symporter [Bacteroidales bacterium]|nr:sodium:solute symporter [Bacteroidales bacterium]